MPGPTSSTPEARTRAEAYYRQANTLLGQGRLEGAAAAYTQALDAFPDHLDARINRGTARFELGQLAAALDDYDAALQLAPADAEVLFNRGNVLQAMKRPGDALEDYDRSLAIDPGFTDARTNRASALLALGRFEDALHNCDAVLAIEPDHVGALINRGSSLWEMKRYDEALASFDRAVALAPGSADALYNRGNAQHVLKGFEEALASFEAALAADPRQPHALTGAADCALKLCDGARWRDYGERLERAIAARTAIVSPFTLLGYRDDPALQRTCAEQYLASRLADLPPPAQVWPAPRAKERLKIAYLSADFRDHPVGQLAAQLLEKHDHDQFEFIGISFGADDRSDIRSRCVRALDSFHDIRGLSDSQAAELIRELGVDIAVDLMGHTQDSRTGILAHRPAPVQAVWLGFPATTGAGFIDFVIGDAVVTPRDAQSWFSEQIVRLPDCYLAADGERGLAGSAPARKDEGLPDQGFVFACFNTAWKFTPPTFEVWMRLLAARPGSVLWLQSAAPAARANLAAQARRTGIDPARLVFTRWLERREDHLARHALADLFLDTLPYNAHATCADALWAGLPVLTCRGGAFASRVAASLLTAAGLPELVTENLQDYERVALELSLDPHRLAGMRTRLLASRDASVLFDVPQFTLNLEAAYRKMWSERIPV